MADESGLIRNRRYIVWVAEKASLNKLLLLFSEKESHCKGIGQGNWIYAKLLWCTNVLLSSFKYYVFVVQQLLRNKILVQRSTVEIGVAGFSVSWSLTARSLNTGILVQIWLEVCVGWSTTHGALQDALCGFIVSELTQNLNRKLKSSVSKSVIWMMNRSLYEAKHYWGPFQPVVTEYKRQCQWIVFLWNLCIEI
jgi:hypothetical protein